MPIYFESFTAKMHCTTQKKSEKSARKTTENVCYRSASAQSRYPQQVSAQQKTLKARLSLHSGRPKNRTVIAEVVQWGNSATDSRPKENWFDSERLAVPQTTNLGRILVYTSSNDVKNAKEIFFNGQVENTFLTLRAYKVEGTIGIFRKISGLSLFLGDKGAGLRMFLKLIVQPSYYRSTLNVPIL